MNSKKIILALGIIALLLMLAPSITALALESQWHGRALTLRENPQFSFKYSLGDSSVSPCTIWIHRDGTGLTIVVIDRSYVDPRDHQKWELWETLRITNAPGEIPKKTFFWSETNGIAHRRAPEGYDIFTRHIMDAKQLPIWVQNLFGGEYGIGESQ